MQIAQVLAGYSLGAADILRRAMGKKKPAEMAKQRLIFVDGSTERDIDEDLANRIFDQMETFAGYGFNKSHSAAYALLAYQTAWLKTHYRAAFMAAVLSADMDNTDKLDDIIHECRDLGLVVHPPDANDSVRMFTMADGQSIRYGLGGLKGLGHAAIDFIITEREKRGQYATLVEFCNRMDLQKVNKRAIEVLIRSGAMDALDPDKNRARMMHELPDALQAAEQMRRNQEAGQGDMFGNVFESSAEQVVNHEPIRPWTTLQSLQAEREALGLYLTGHPTQIHAADIARLTHCRLGEIATRVPAATNKERRGGVPITVAGMIQSIRRRINRGCFLGIEDATGRIEVSLFEDTWSQYADLLTKDEIIVVEGRASPDDFSGGYRMTAQKIQRLADAKRDMATGVLIALRGPGEDICDQLQSTILPYRKGNGSVTIDYTNGRARARLDLGGDWKVVPCEELVAALEQLDAVSDVRLVY